MSSSTQNKIITGRPYGGTGFIFNKKYVKSVKPLLSCSHERVTALELNTSLEKCIVINGYFPYYNVRDLDNYLHLYQETVGFIDNLMTQNSNSKFILLADFNFNMYDDSHRYTQLICPLMNKFNLICALDSGCGFDPSSEFSRYDIKTKSYSLIGGILISEEIVSSILKSLIWEMLLLIICPLLWKLILT